MNRFFIIAALLLPACIYGQTYTTPVRVNLDKSLRTDQSPMMKLDRSGNIYIAWISGIDMNANGPISMAVSTDGGMTFTNQLVCGDAMCNSNFQRTAQFVIDSKNTIHLVWMANRVNNQGDIWYTRSTDQGKTWTKPITIDDADDSSKYAQDFPSIGCDSSDNLYVSFLDSRMVQRGLAKTPLLFFSRSTNAGMTWSVNKRADVPPGGIGGVCSCCTESMAVTADGHIYIVYRSDINNLRDIWLERSYDKGMTFQPALKVVSADWNIDACPVSGPHIVLDDAEGAHIVWRDQRDDSSNVHLYYAYVPNASTLIPVNTAFDVAGSQLPNYPDIALYDHGKYHVIAYETFNFGMRYILTDGTTPIGSANRPIQANGSSGKSFANVRFAADGTRYLCWQDDITDGGDIYFMKETMALPKLVSDSLPGKVILLNPLPDAVVPVPVALVWEKSPNALYYHVTVYPKMDSDPPYIPVYDSTGIMTTSIIIPNLKPMFADWRYEWYVSAINAEGEGQKSSQQFLTTKASVAETPPSTFTISPNPISKDNPIIHIERESNLSATLRIVDLLGRQVTSIPLSSEASQTITLPKMAPGIYYCILSDGSSPKKIIVGQ